MIADHRYCHEIVNQLKANRAALQSLEVNIIEVHMQHCVKDAFHSRDPVIIKEKIDEIVFFMKRQS